MTAVIVAVTTGCGDRDPEQPFVTGDSAGVAIVESSRPRWEPGREWRVADAPSVTIGSPDGSAETSLYRVRRALRLDDGRIAIANSGSDEIRFYTPEGTYESAVGGAGGGPGEFDTISRMWRGADSIFVYDFQQGNRVSVFTTAGAFVRFFNLRPAPDGGIPLDADGLSAGRILVPLSGGRPSPTGLAVDTSLFLLYSTDGEPADTVGWLPGGETYFSRLPSGSVAGRERPFGLTARRAAGNGGLYFGSSASYEIRWYDDRGVLSRLIRRPVSNPAITAEERAAWEAERAAEYARASPVFRELLDRVEVPATRPAHGPLIVDAGGNLWVAEYRRREEHIRRWDVFDPAGQWLGTVATPRGLRLHDIGKDYVLGVRRDELDVEYVQIHRLEKPEGTR